MATEEILKQFIGNEFIESKDILGATAKGTEENFYLDPIPQLNKLGYIYSNIIGNINSRISARTDSIKMNRDNMDYTNDGNNSGEKVYDLSIAKAFDLNNDGVVGEDDANILLKYYACKGTGAADLMEEYFNRIFTYNMNIDEAEDLPPELTDYKSENRGNYPDRIIADIDGNAYYYYKYDDTNDCYLFIYTDDNNQSLEYYQNLFTDKLNILEKYTAADATTVSAILSLISDNGDGKPYVTFQQIAEYFNFYNINYYLNLLMPQYKRRVEIEDLDENFWVIGQVLDAVVNSIFGQDNIIDILIDIINRLEEIDIQIDIINKMVGIGKVNKIEWEYNNIKNSKLSFYQNINMSNFSIVLSNDYGTRKIGFPIGNKSGRNLFGYDEILLDNISNKKNNFKKVFFKNSEEPLVATDVFKNLSNQEKRTLPVECLLWRRNQGNATYTERCMASFADRESKDVSDLDNQSRNKIGAEPYCTDDYEVLLCNGDGGYFYGLLDSFEVILYDQTSYKYKNGELILKDSKNSNFINGFNDYYKEEQNKKPILFMPSKSLYNGEVIVIKFDNVCIQDQVPQYGYGDNNELDSADPYWSVSQRYFYRTTRENADGENKNNKISLYYYNKDSIFYENFNQGIRNVFYMPITILSMESNSIDNDSQYTILNGESLNYNHYYNVARGGALINCYGYAGYSDSEGVYVNSAVGILSEKEAYSSTSGFCQSGTSTVTKITDYASNINLSDLDDSEKYDSYSMFKKLVKEQKISSEETFYYVKNVNKNTTYPFIPFAFKVRNFNFLRKNYINSAKIGAEYTSDNWYCAAPTVITAATIIDGTSLEKITVTRSKAYVDGAKEGYPQASRTEITFNFGNFIFDDSIFIMSTNWRDNYDALMTARGKNVVEYPDYNFVPRVLNLSFFGYGSLGAPGTLTPHTH